MSYIHESEDLMQLSGNASKTDLQNQCNLLPIFQLAFCVNWYVNLKVQKQVQGKYHQSNL
jgi:hypothetical protein